MEDMAPRLSNCDSWALEGTGFNSCSVCAQYLWYTDSVIVPQGDSVVVHMDLVAVQHVESSQTRD